MTTPKTRREQAEEAAKKYLETEHRGRSFDEMSIPFKSFLEAVQWADSTPTPDAGDEEAANKYWREHRDFHDSDGVDVCQVFKDGAAHARRPRR